MEIHLCWGDESVCIDTTRRLELSQPLSAKGPHPAAFGIPPLAAQRFEVPGFVGDTRRGGPCNVETLTLTPHGNGTHTESIGHVIDDAVPVPPLVAKPFFPAVVRYVTPVQGADTTEPYTPALKATDVVITAKALAAEGPLHLPPGGALVVLTGTPPAAQFTTDTSPFFTHAAMQWLVAEGVEHLLVDLPSVDRLEDEGLLSNHRLFWGLPLGSTQLAHALRPTCTLTEWLAPREKVASGRYFVGIEIPPLESDAAPSRCFLYPFQTKGYR